LLTETNKVKTHQNKNYCW